MRTATKREQNAKRQGDCNTHEGQNQRYQKAAPEWRFHEGQTEPAANQQEECHKWEDEEEQNGVERLLRHLRYHKRHEKDDEQQSRQIDPPALINRIAAIDELLIFGLYESPASAGPAVRLCATLCDGQTDRAVGSTPHRVDEKPLNGGRQKPDQHEQGEDCQSRIGWRREEIDAQPVRKALYRTRRLFAIDHFRADILEIGFFHGHLSTSAILALNQFIMADVTRLMPR